MIGRPQVSHEIGLGSRFDPVEDVDLEAVLLADKGREQTDRAGTGHEHGPRLPERPLADGSDLLPRLGNDGGGLEQHAQETEGSVDLHGVLGLDSPALGHEPVDLLDASLGVLAIPAHVPLAHGTVGARHWVRTANNADHEITLLERAARARVHHAAEGLVSKHKAGLAPGCPAILAFHDFDVGPAYADRDGLHEHRPAGHVRLRDVFQARGVELVRLDGDGLHASFPPGVAWLRSLRTKYRYAPTLSPLITIATTFHMTTGREAISRP